MPAFSTKTKRRRQSAYRFSADHRAVAAAAMISEKGWSAKRAAGLFCVNRNYVSLACRMSEADRARLIKGDISLSQLANGRRQPTDSEVDRIVTRIGLERILTALDRATRPTVSSASASNNNDGPAEWWMEMTNAPHAVAAE